VRSARCSCIAGRGRTAIIPGDRRLGNPGDHTARSNTYYRVEEQFTNAIRGTEQVTMVAFETSVHYMEWTEALHRNSQTGQTVYLPL
jgi:hypothetical protein